ncbi:ATP-dependent Lon protease [Melioribacter roseus P3M-2]|jgi:ATP-dependent Lon protease|uniref:Lon protease n=1 Tax=Melioribacter roseus (strain DSM 23840 / JCM 17771 / VKM B-2668 / P3M-2) TaxID=1191523 RepID=I7A571_MELRP|nr:endopeptidase La [Melioribacter roseus]AFN75026.1 ATP-dependent Lon protease [Melioribacter roseus P3M-2]
MEEKIKASENDYSMIEDIPNKLPVLPLRDTVVFPYMIFPVLVGREQSIKAANFALENSKYIFLAAQKKASIEEPTPEDIYPEGTIAKIIQILKLPNGLLKILVDGVIQGRIVRFTDRKEFFEAELEVITPTEENPRELNALLRQMSNLFKEYVKINKAIPPEAINAFENIDEPDRKLFYVAANINQSIEVKQKILQHFSLKDQLYEVIRILNSEIEILKIEKEIENKVQENIAKTQRKFIIQEQIRILQEELGDEEEIAPEFVKLKEQIEKAKMPKPVYEKAIDELNKLKKTPPSSPEATVIRNYLDWLIAVPWHKKTRDNLDVKNVRKILDEDHYGLEKPKERIVEHIAVLNLVKSMRGQILCFVGPPGVGKTSLGKSIARALGRNFVRISLGGVRDEAEIRGHRRTYIGSMPGKIIQSMKKAKTINPVMLLDEIDKMSMDFRGDPSSAMLEVLDPEQNHSFNDHYLDVDYDLSQVMFITTANVRYNIPLPLQDRMEIIELPGYLEFEKLEIAKRHIIPKQLKAHGLDKFKIEIQDEAIKKIINEYTRESGVRNLEREIASVFRKTAHEIVISTNGKKKPKLKITITPETIEKYLGVPRFRPKKADKELRVGSVTGLAWTSVGGEILQVDATVMDGQEKLTLTGQIGNVMKESALAALSYLRSNAKELGLPANFHKGKEVHIHLPEGAIPKDGPSAGITMAMALYSVFSGKPARNDVAMTGEITLRGKVIPIGGLNEKLLAAQRNGMSIVLIPKDNEKDLTEIKPEVKEGLQIIPIETIKDAIPYVFGKITGTRKKKTTSKKSRK